MKTERLKQYIQFAIDNGLKLEGDFGTGFDIYVEDNSYIEFELSGEEYNIIELITSKEFIEAIARGLWNLAPYGKSKGTKVKMIFSEVGQLNYETQEELYEDLTIFQAIAIRDNKLEYFITNLLKNEN